jgi:putative membrane protein
MHGGADIIFGGFMWLFWLLVIAAIIVVIMSAINSSSGNNNRDEDSPLEILKKRYALGEIDEEEYTRLRKQIEN